MIARVVNAIVPDRFGVSPSIPATRERTKSDWLAEWTERGREGGRVLKRFPDTPVTWAQWRATPDVFA